jgi:predicted Ser/Thr protein kinase
MSSDRQRLLAALRSGTTARLGPYAIEAPIGHGGMGEVFRARDTRLERAVAIKISTDEFGSRFAHEARAVAALNHPHICTLYDIGPDYLVMELVEGETLAHVLDRGDLPLDRAIEYAAQIADALAAAHAAGIVHRDLKPSNVMIAASGVKVLDFGVAKRVSPDGDEIATETAGPEARLTRLGELVGTVEYMSPEQAEGRPLDGRSDVFSFGIVFYQMLCGARPFRGVTKLATLAAILQAEPARPSALRPGVPEIAERIVLRCLQKVPADRYGSARELHRDLAALSTAKRRRPLRSKAAVAAAIVILAIIGAFGVRRYRTWESVRWAEHEAPAEIEQLIAGERRLEAYRRYRDVLRIAPASRALEAIGLTSIPITIRTTPAGARVSVADYVDAGPDRQTAWSTLGIAPVTTDELSRGGYYRLRVEKDGFAPVEMAIDGRDQAVDVVLHENAHVPAGMVWVPGASAGQSIRLRVPADFEGFWLDAFEVSNRQFKAFVDAGGYAGPQHWREPFVRGGVALSWDQAMTGFRDATGRPGPAAWQFGTYPDGAADHPVAGIS